MLRVFCLVLCALVLAEGAVLNNIEDMIVEKAAAAGLNPSLSHSRNKRQSDESCQQADIIMVLDSSGSIGKENWLKVLSFAKTMVQGFPVGPSDVRFGINTYGNRATLAFNLNTYNTSDQYLAAIDDIGWKDQATNTSGGIRLMYRDMFTEENGDRSGVPNIGIVVTDGESNRDQNLTIPEADKARDKGILVFALGIGDAINQVELNGIGNNDKDFVFNVDSFDALETIKDQLVSAACEAAAACSFDSDLVLIFDSSGSIGATNFENMKTFVADFIEDLNVTPDETHVGVVSFSDDAKVEFDLNVGKESRIQVMELITAIPFRSGTTNTADALKVAREDIFGRSGDRSNLQNIIVLFTDGGSNDYSETLSEAIRTRLDGITILVVAIGNWVNNREIYEIASDPDSANVFTVSEVNDIPSIRSQFKGAVCNDQDNCATRPCRNGGTCLDGINDYICVCTDDWAGINCQIPCSNPKDIAIAMDSSDSISNQNFYAMQDFVKVLARTLPLDRNDHSRMSVEVYADNPEVKFNLDAYDQKSDYVDAISFLREKGETNSAGALKTMREDMFDSGNGDRGNAQNVGIFITDGGSSNRDATLQEAIATRADDIYLLAVGVGTANKFYNRRELRGIASEPHDSTIFYSDDYLSLTDLNDAIVTAVCNDEDACDDNPCDEGQCVDLIGDFYCECDDDYNGRLCDRNCGREMDLVILLDNSGSIRSSRFANIFKPFVQSIVGDMDVRLDATRVGLLTFNTDANVQFHLNTYQSREDVLHAIEMVPYERGRTNMADALQKAREEMLTSGNGARDDAPDIIIMVTDGRATVNPERTLPEAIETKLAGVHIIVAAAEQSATSLELKGIASDPDAANLFAVDKFQDMPTIAPNIVSATCNSVDECDDDPCENGADCVDELGYYQCSCRSSNTGRDCERDCTARMDLTLIFDVSGSLESYVDMQIELAKQVVYGLNFAGGRVRVGAVTFSDDASIQFTLNEYNDQQSVLIAISFLQDRRGRTNTASALSLTADQMFSNSNGGRSGDPDIVILMTDGNSNINQGNTGSEAENLRNDNVRLLVVGVGESANRGEINEIATDPDNSNTFYVEQSSDIPGVANSILDELCE